MTDAIEAVAKALYVHHFREQDITAWDSPENDHRKMYRDHAKVCVDAYNAFIQAEAKRPGYSTPAGPAYEELVRKQMGAAGATLIPMGERDFTIEMVGGGGGGGKVPCVLQDWVQMLPLMQQTVLLTCIRGPDGVPKYGPVKMVLRWFRRCTLLSAMDKATLTNPYDPRGGSFTGPSITFTDKDWRSAMDVVVGKYMQELDAIPLHFHTHLVHGAQIIGFKHPDPEIRHWWNWLYRRFVHHMHLHPETEAEMDKRLGDNRDDWLERNDPATVD